MASASSAIFRLQSGGRVACAGLGPAIRDDHVADDVGHPTPPLPADWTKFAMPACLNRLRSGSRVADRLLHTNPRGLNP